MITRPINLLITCLLLIATHCCAQETPMLHYTIDDGLPSNTVYCAYRDKQGFLWFGTDKGIVRYNGISFESFTTGDGLADNEVFHFHEDQEGRLWMSTYNGKLCFYKNGKFYSDANTPFLKLPFTPFCTMGIFPSYDDGLTLWYRDPSKFLYIKNNKVTVYNIPESLQFKAEINRSICQTIYRSGKNEFIFQCINREIFTDTLLRVQRVKVYPDSFVINGQNILYQNKIFSVNWQYIAPSPVKMQNYSLETTLKIAFVYADDKNSFFCTQDGLLSSNNFKLLKETFITSIASDINGNYWITTHKHGIYCISKHFRSNTNFEKVYIPPITSAYHNNGKFYYRFPGRHSLYCFDNGHNNRIIKHELDTKEDYLWACYQPTSAKNFVVFGNQTGYKPGKEAGIRLKPFLIKDRGFISSTSFLSHQYIYGLHQKQIIRFDTNDYKKEFITPDIVSKPEDARIISKALDPQQYLWFSTIDGVYKIYGLTPVTQLLINKTFRKFAFLGEYLIGYNPENYFYVYKKQNGNYNFVQHIIEYNTVWGDIYKLNDNTAIISTNRTYWSIRISPDKENTILAPINNHFIPKNADYVYADSTYCFFVKDGNITRLPLQDMFEKEIPPRVLFTRIKTNKQNIDFTSDLSIKGSEANNISIGFSNISFLTKDLVNEYSISTDPKQDQWREIEGNVLNFTSPGYNTYFIKVRTRSRSSEYSEPALLKLTITRPVWLTWWAITIEVICIAIILFFLTRMIIIYILNRRRKMYDLESRYHSAEYKTLNALMNPHFIFNSLNNIKGLMNRDDKKTANKFLNSFSNVIRQNMQNLSKEVVSLGEEIELVSKYLELEKLRFGDIINYEVNIEKGIDLEELFIPPLLIQPLAENAVKHGLLPKKSADGLISVNIYEKQQSVFVAIKDNGVGLNNSDYSEHEGYESLGLSNIEKRLSYLRQSGKQKIFFDIRPDKDQEGKVSGTIAIIEIQP